MVMERKSALEICRRSRAEVTSWSSRMFLPVEMGCSINSQADSNHAGTIILLVN